MDKMIKRLGLWTLALVAPWFVACHGTEQPWEEDQPPIATLPERPTASKVTLHGPTCPSDETSDLCSQLKTEDFSAVHGTTDGLRWFAQEDKLWGAAPNEQDFHLEYRYQRTEEDGTEWQAKLKSVFAVSARDAWAVGKQSKPGAAEPLVLHWDGETWTEHKWDASLYATEKKYCNLKRVYAVGKQVWVVGGDFDELDGVAWALRDGKWSQVALPTVTKKGVEVPAGVLHAVWGTDANNIWAVGNGGIILKWDPNTSSFSLQTSTVSNHLHGVWGTDTSNVWAVGENGAILKWDGTKWASETPMGTKALLSVWGTDANNVWAVGADGEIVRRTDSTWKKADNMDTKNLNSVWGIDKDNVWAVGKNGLILPLKLN